MRFHGNGQNLVLLARPAKLSRSTDLLFLFDMHLNSDFFYESMSYLAYGYINTKRWMSMKTAMIQS